jgi:hypothetical protein
VSATRQLPSMGRRLANALLGWSLLWGLGVALAVGFAAQHEVDELLDESLQSTAMVMGRALALADLTPLSVQAHTLPSTDDGEFAWQVVSSDGRMLLRAANAPAAPLQRTPQPGFDSAGGWRIFGTAIGGNGRMLYVAHTQRERVEAQFEVALNAVLAALSIGLLGHVWLRLKVRRELQPLQALSERLRMHDPLARSPLLGAAERAELAPVHAAIDALGQRLADRVAQERAFATHAAHALRTPLAGMDAQLAVALRGWRPSTSRGCSACAMHRRGCSAWCARCCSCSAPAAKSGASASCSASWCRTCRWRAWRCRWSPTMRPSTPTPTCLPRRWPTCSTTRSAMAPRTSTSA